MFYVDKVGSDVAKGKFEYWLTEDGLLLLSGWARDGLSKEQMAHNMNISRATLNQWEKRFSDISDAIKKGRDVVDYEVENALYKKALTGDVGAIVFLLKNRRKDRWKDKPIDLNEGVDKLNENIDSLKELLQNPAPDRKLPDE